MVAFSKAVEEAMWGDAAVLRYLAMAKDAYASGERDALLGVVMLCARYQAVIPDWAVDVLLEIERDIENGEISDFNEAFGWTGERKNTRQKNARQARARADVLQALQTKRLAGGSLNADEMFGQIVEDLRAKGLKVNRRDVEDVYKKHGQFIKNLPRHPNPNARFAQVNIVVPNPRRHGRPTLKD